MQEQNFKNHVRFIPLWHFIIPLIIGGILGWGIILFCDHHMYPHFLGAAMILISLVLFVTWWYARAFALRAHDKAIRAEENFRYYLLTGKPFPKELRMGQIIALRFASDEEMPPLVKKAIDENLSAKQIKQEIRNWKADHNRV